MSSEAANMENKRLMLDQIVKARENIRRKHLALKLGKESAQEIIIENLKPITQPLKKIEKIVENLETPNYDENTFLQLPSSTPYKNKTKTLNLGFKTALSDEISKDEEKEEYDESVEISDTFNDSSSPNKKENTMNISNYLNMFKISTLKKLLDDVYGVRKMTDGTLKIGDADVKFDNNEILVGDSSYAITNGLLELIFKKNPAEKLVEPEDLKNFGKIIKSTNAHRKWYLPSEAIRSNTSKKYLNYVKKVINTSGDGVSLLPKYMETNNSQIQYMHWDDPNELVERLKLLVAEREAGNNNHDNEIHSIIEELREAKFIY